MGDGAELYGGPLDGLCVSGEYLPRQLFFTLHGENYHQLRSLVDASIVTTGERVAIYDILKHKGGVRYVFNSTRTISN